MIQKNKIGIIGCGWLGIPLSKLLLKKGYLIKGSTTSKNKLQKLRNLKINPFLIKICEDEIIGDINSFLKNLDILIINIPPKKIKTSNNSYARKIYNLNRFIKKNLIDKIIFISSTSVYGSNQGKVDFKTVPIPNSKNGIEILESEKIIIKNKKCTIIRLGGLIGENRHPAYYLSKKNIVSRPDTPVNLIHLKDCLEIICSVIEKEKWGEKYLGVCPYHPKKADYYNKKCREFGLKEVKFEKNYFTGKEITDSRIKKDLNHDFIFPRL